MIYLENDFYSNFNSMQKSNDEISMRGLLFDQISSVPDDQLRLQLRLCPTDTKGSPEIILDHHSDYQSCQASTRSGSYYYHFS